MCRRIFHSNAIYVNTQSHMICEKWTALKRAHRMDHKTNQVGLWTTTTSMRSSIEHTDLCWYLWASTDAYPDAWTISHWTISCGYMRVLSQWFRMVLQKKQNPLENIRRSYDVQTVLNAKQFGLQWQPARIQRGCRVSTMLISMLILWKCITSSPPTVHH